MSSRAKSEVDSTAGSKARVAIASALKARMDLLLVAESDGPVTFSNRAHNKSSIGTHRAHDKSTTDAPVVPNLSGAARARALRLAGLLASSHSD
jgi:hypothetical protein